ncbi:MAG: glycosyltransferase, partial [Clostridiales bacterium]|nr:glycosyltransferase [Clostridiales bacterium]
RICTVSPSYAEEIMTREGGEGLDGLMCARSGQLCGILNGIDYEAYNPQTDPYIDVNYSHHNFVSGKRKNKAAVQKALGLPVRQETFVIGIVSRLTEQKGFDLIASVLDEMLNSMDIQLLVLGTGELKYENLFHKFQAQYPEKVSSYIGYSDEKAQKIYAASDAFLMPSQFEPCGLSQMVAMRYGTIPVVRETGGLKDTVVSYNEYEDTGTGFSFRNYNAYEMLTILRYANAVFTDQRSHWNAMAARGMSADFSWNSSAKKYEELYSQLCG